MKVFKRVFTYKLIGVPGEIRILDTMIKSQLLYPTELKARMAARDGVEPPYRGSKPRI